MSHMHLEKFLPLCCLCILNVIFAQAAYKALFVAISARLRQNGVFHVHHKLLPLQP